MPQADVQLRPLFSPERIQQRVAELAAEVADCYGGEPIVLLPILSGSLIFVADLVRKLPMDMVIEVCGLSSYRDGTSPGHLDWTLAPPKDLAGRHVLIVDDILDSGATVSRVRAAVGQQSPASLRSCVLLVREPVNEAPDFGGFHIGPGFVVGYGLDFRGRYRNLPGISLLVEE